MDAVRKLSKAIERIPAADRGSAELVLWALAPDILELASAAAAEVGEYDVLSHLDFLKELRTVLQEPLREVIVESEVVAARRARDEGLGPTLIGQRLGRSRGNVYNRLKAEG